MFLRPLCQSFVTVSCILLLLFCAPSLVVGEESSVSRPEVLFRLAGSNTVGGRLAPALVMDYLRTQGAEGLHTVTAKMGHETRVLGRLPEPPGYRSIAVDIVAYGSSTGFKWLDAGRADIAMSSRKIKRSETQMLARFGNMTSFDAEHVIAIDGLAIIVHPDNPLKQLSMPLLKKIFSGEINNWLQLGGNDQDISLYARDENSGTWDIFKQIILGSQFALSPNAGRYESNDELSVSLGDDRGGIGFVPLTAVGDSKVLAISGRQTRAMQPQPLNLATEDYPLSRRLYLYSKSTAVRPHVEGFIDFVMSRRGQTVVEGAGFVSQNIIAVQQPVIDTAPDSYLALSQQAKRLSVNFYFTGSSTALDSKAQRDLRRLERYFSALDGAQRVWLVGFSDTRAKSSLEGLLGKYRALIVKNKLVGKVDNIEPVMSLGAFMPIANNDDLTAKMKNGRVEIWVSE